MNAASPRRRAALAPLDANAATTTPPPSTTGKPHASGDYTTAPSTKPTPLHAMRKSSSGSLLLSSAPALPPPTTARAAAVGSTPSVGGKKRPGTDGKDAGQDQQAVKKSKLDHERDDDRVPESTQSSTTTNVTNVTTSSSATAVAAAGRSRTHSPDVSSLFDSAEADSTWATTTTEPDPVAPVIVPAIPRPNTRVEILRLRLGLASYKLRTGQVDVPLADLQPRRLPPVGTPPPPAIVRNAAEQREREEDEVVEETPPSTQESAPAPAAAVAALATMASR
ncbi:cyclin-dependent kinase [Cordyceps fumosorosea ARSEF 2679]|uniref:Cyclin-dependent kinase n=1 Tax=Cordyceps fumosorosea (strain ARSEF 2679) TaxID=1081104 RepID=A0A167PAI5_CORFA|nr:cyclin-dependent kinase [Cordyceps fumosorosea ARSEF 2679]OAA56459.1 cyclin-dependent kinase [Cordyceps fumosorosea ARSEF 2679]